MKFRFQFDHKTSYIKVNRRGTIYILLTIAIGFAATNTMNNLLYILLSFLLAIMGISGIFARKNLSGITFSVLPPPEIYRNTPAPFKIILRSRSKKFNVIVEIERVKRTVPMLDGEFHLTIPLKFARRGIHRIERFTLTSSFPFGFFTREEVYELPVEFIVYPHVYRISPEDYFHFDSLTAGIREGRRMGTGGDFMGLRRYEDGDPVRLIHWKASSKELVTKVFSGPSSVEIVLGERDLKSRDLENQIDEIASLTVALLRSGYSVGINFHGVKIRPGTGEHHRIKILSRLSKI